jgi:UDP-2,3-diacylglucosamine hydrolase
MELRTKDHWDTVDFISDLHLQAQEPQTLVALASYLESSPAQALFILGDLFEVWVGDDCLDQIGSFEAQVAALLKQASQTIDIHILCGNRDFLMGSDCMAACGATRMEDPTVLQTPTARWLLTHGDALCLSDTAYLDFRMMVRSPQWQHEFLQKPLAQRQAIGREMRMQSEAKKMTHTGFFADVDTVAAIDTLQQHKANHMIHGHTHRPAHHALDATHSRWVLSDWDGSAAPPRAEVLRINLSKETGAQATQATRITLPHP